jgi:hypothetical protein
LFKNWTEEILYKENKQDEDNVLGEPIIRFEYGNISLDVAVSPKEKTVWLTQAQICELFNASKQSVSAHIQNIYDEKELDEPATVNFFLTVQKEGNRDVTRSIKVYNLKMIMAISYRIKSDKGIIFRNWATSVLEKYLLNGYVIDSKRIMAYQSNILQLEADVTNIENRLKKLEMTIYSDNTQIIFEGEILEPYTFLRKLFFLAQEEITIIDPYADKFLLTMLSDLKVKITIVTSTSSYLNKEEIPDNITVIHNDVIHDRFIIVDDNVYAMGTSINDIGKKRFFMMRLEDVTKEMILAKKKK